SRTRKPPTPPTPCSRPSATGGSGPPSCRATRAAYWSSTSTCKATERQPFLPPDPASTGSLFGPAFSTDAMRAAFSDRAWLQAMLDVEAALAAAEARVGLIPEEAASAIAGSCRADRFDLEAIGRETVAAGTPVVPLVRALTGAVPGDAARYVHWGATTQDVGDTAA